MSKQTKNKRKKLKINKSGIKTMRLDKKAIAREAEALKIKYMTHFHTLLDKIAGAESNADITERLIKEYETIDKITNIVIGTNFFMDRQKEVLDNIEKINNEISVNIQTLILHETR